MINLEVLRDILGWCAAINIGILLFWFFIFLGAKNWLHKFHGRWFSSLSVETFEAIHYATMAFFKLSIFLFFLVPYLVLRFLI